MRSAGVDVDGFARKSGLLAPNLAELFRDPLEDYHGIHEIAVDFDSAWPNHVSRCRSSQFRAARELW
jgi:hypothetical protein